MISGMTGTLVTVLRLGQRCLSAVCLMAPVRVASADCARLVGLFKMPCCTLGWTTIFSSHFFFAVAVFCHVSVTNGIYDSVVCSPNPSSPPSSCVPQLTLLSSAPACTRRPSAALKIQPTHCMTCAQQYVLPAGGRCSYKLSL